MTALDLTRQGDAAVGMASRLGSRLRDAFWAVWDALERAGQRRAAAELGRVAAWHAHDEALAEQLRSAAAAARAAGRTARSMTPGGAR